MSVNQRKKIKKEETREKAVFKHKGNPKGPKEWVELLSNQDPYLSEINSQEVSTFHVDLSLVQNQLFTEALTIFKQLRVLKLENCSLSNFYPEESKINMLQSLSLKNNRLEDIQ